MYIILYSYYKHVIRIAKAQEATSARKPKICSCLLCLSRTADPAPGSTTSSPLLHGTFLPQIVPSGHKSLQTDFTQALVSKEPIFI